jgi:hypothetical protein
MITHWNKLPDPCSWVADGPDGSRSAGKCSLVAYDWNWRHVVKHVRNPAEPWKQWVSDAVVREVVDVLGGAQATLRWDDAIRRLANNMKHAVLQSLQRPLAVLIRERRYRKDRPVPKWILVLPSGAQMIAGCAKPNENVLLTCFFPEEVCDEEPEDRWRVLAAMIVRQYCPKVQGGKHGHPAQWQVFIKGEDRRLHDRINFVTLASWGFNVTDKSWSAKIEDWLPSAAAAKVKSVLVPRRSNEESEVSHESE